METVVRIYCTVQCYWDVSMVGFLYSATVDMLRFGSGDLQFDLLNIF